MSSSAKGQGVAPNAAVEAGQVEPTAQQRYLNQRADDAEQAVTAIEAKITGMQETLKAAKADAKAARAAAQKGV